MVTEGPYVYCLRCGGSASTRQSPTLLSECLGQGVPEPYIQLLRSLYADQRGRVRTDVLSDEFNIQRGTKQGDPLSSLLFNALLEHCLRPCKKEWYRKRYGLRLDPLNNNMLTNLRFADDVLAVAPTLHQIKQMLSDIQRSTANVGLSLHPGKTKIFTNANRKSGRQAAGSVHVNGLEIEIIPRTSTTKYLGRLVSCDKPFECELNNRIRKAWAAYGLHKQELTSRSYPLKDRIRLLNSTVAPTLLYGSEVWPMTRDVEHQITCAQRRMLRHMLGAKRRTIQTEGMENTDVDCADVDSNPEPEQDYTSSGASESTRLEPWADFIRRATRATEEHLQTARMEPWVHQQRRRKWRWAFRVANMDTDRWASQAMYWDPALTSISARRATGRPKRRWDDDVREYIYTQGIYTSWQSYALSHDAWNELEDGFATR